MKPEEVFKRYDIRGDHPGEINGEFAERLGKALGTFALRNHGEKVVIGRDNKESSGLLKERFTRGLKKTGVKVLDAGVGPTDYVAFTGKENDAVSVQVTSSHMPLDMNGFKFMYPEGNGFLNPDLYEVQDLFRDQDFEEGEAGSKDISSESRERYLEEIKEFFRGYFDSIDRKVVVDTLGGASTEYLPGLMKELGAEVVDVAGEKGAEKPYIDPPNPSPEKLRYIEERVEEENADMAVASDMDADRAAVYFRGEWLSGSKMFALLSRLVDSGRNVVASIDTSRALEDLVSRQGGEVFYTRVGDPFVINEAIERDAQLAGEANGHYCFPGFVPYNSGTLAGLLLSAVDLEKGLEEIPEYHTERSNIRVEDRDSVMEKIVRKAKEDYEVVSELDGVKFRIGDATVLARLSGSSPVIRLIAESRDISDAEKALEEAESIVRNP